ncbi:MAG TPA: AsmA family protein [Casimicrobiaceae bacterium]|nr:AsmA family protein [Casimicrobiaceae bacterium]
MRRTAFIILGATAAVVALLLIGAAIAIKTLDPNRFVAPLAARIKAATGRELSVHGPIEYKLSLTPKLMLPDVAFENAPWSKTPQMLTAKRVEAQVALLPLLSRRFDVIEFILVEPAIILETDASGHGNWEFGPPATNTGASSSAASTSSNPMAFGIGNFEIRQGTLTYRDGASGKLTSASIERMSMRARDMSTPIAVEFRGTIDDLPVAVAGDLGPPSQWLAQQWPYPLALKGQINGNDAKLSTKLAKAGTTMTLDDIDIRYGKIAATGRIRSITEAGKRRYGIELNVPSLALADVPQPPQRVAQPATATAPPSTLAAKQWMIADTPLPLGPLGAIEGEGTLSIGELTLRSGQVLSHVTTQFSSRDAVVDAKFAAESMLGGSLHGEAQIDGRRSDAPAIHVQATAQGLDLPKLAAAAGITREIRGGKVRVSVDINGRGTTPHRVASTMSGTIVVVSGPATLGRATTQGETAVSQVAGALDPFRSVDAATELRCAVFRLPLNNGVAHVDRSIAIETGKIDGSASGTVDFRDETLDLSVQPQVRAGVKFDVSELAGLVRIRGRFDKPAVAIDAAQSAQLIAKLGVLGAKGGGLVEIGRALVAPQGESAGSPCAIAERGSKSRVSAPATAAQPRSTDTEVQKALPKDLPKDIGNALGKLLGR